ncbi:ParE family toxin-like protein [Hymenobacter actinosclerus]|uniref:mRNA interferase HigB n=1 Tax=Hymenobacter actinosclerus TaxID=82805 RepID=A0A1I0EHC2_9BACT|nr:hypothetical protein [Hymenobacter actinosclerus]SET44491.1 hypothetical protein SAMN04487998_1842 [Hymenobacter actinosclerus]
MKHQASSRFWQAYNRLPADMQRLADKNYDLWLKNPAHPSLHFKKVGRFWSARVGLHYRALGVETDDVLVWFWIGSHTDYDLLIK